MRLAKGAGLNRDARGSEKNPVHCQVRKLLWHQILFLDFLTAEGQGPQPTTHEDEFDTSMPLNIQDDALDQPHNESVSMCSWTDSTFSIIRYECSMVQSLIFRQCLAIENGQTDLESVQRLVGVHRMHIERQYLQNLDESIPIQRCAKLVGRLLTSRFDAILLHTHSHFDVKTESSQTDIRET